MIQCRKKRTVYRFNLPALFGMFRRILRCLIVRVNAPRRSAPRDLQAVLFLIKCWGDKGDKVHKAVSVVHCRVSSRNFVP